MLEDFTLTEDSRIFSKHLTIHDRFSIIDYTTINRNFSKTYKMWRRKNGGESLMIHFI